MTDMNNSIPSIKPALRSKGDFLKPSVNPPAELCVDTVPQFVVLACDDNPHVDSMRWMLDFLKDKKNPAGSGQPETYDGQPARTSFFSCGRYLDWSEDLQRLHREAYQQGHEIGNHTQNHQKGDTFSVTEWINEIAECQSAFERAGLPKDSVYGFRAPYVEYNEDAFIALQELGFTYDASLEEGAQQWANGENYLWPYTLDDGSPGNDILVAEGIKKPIGKHKGLWHIGNNYIVIPPDDKCEEYGCRAGIRKRVFENIHRNYGWEWQQDAGKLPGFDYNMWVIAQLLPEEALATLKYTLDLRLQGNRSPFLFGAHVECNPDNEPGKRAALEAFVDYALSLPAVRLVPAYRIVEWLRNPIPLVKQHVAKQQAT